MSEPVMQEPVDVEVGLHSLFSTVDWNKHMLMLFCGSAFTLGSISSMFPTFISQLSTPSAEATAAVLGLKNFNGKQDNKCNYFAPTMPSVMVSSFLRYRSTLCVCLMLNRNMTAYVRLNPFAIFDNILIYFLCYKL